MNRNRLLFLATALVILVGDVVTKRLVVSNMVLHEVRRVFGDWVRLTYIHNEGAAFGLFPGSRVILIAISVLAVLIVVWIAWKRETRLVTVFPLGLILGGAIGNLIDRIRLGMVVDFVQAGIPPDHYWPVFNVADSAVTVGVVWLAVGLVFGGHARDESSASSVTSEEPVAGVAASRDDG